MNGTLWVSLIIGLTTVLGGLVATIFAVRKDKGTLTLSGWSQLSEQQVAWNRSLYEQNTAFHQRVEELTVQEEECQRKLSQALRKLGLEDT